MEPTEALEHALGGPPAPGTLRALIREAGGTNRNLALAVIGYDPAGDLPGKGTAARRRYDNEMRTIQRWLKAKRGSKIYPRTLAKWQRAIREIRGAEFVEKIRENGCMARVRSDCYIAGYFYPDKQMPIGEGDTSTGERLTAADCIEFTQPWVDNEDIDGALDLFAAVFGDAYEVEDLEIVADTEYIHLWLAGQPETGD